MSIGTYARDGEVLLVAGDGSISRHLVGGSRQSSVVLLVAGEAALGGGAADEAILARRRVRGALQLREVRGRGLGHRLRLHTVDAHDPVLGGEGLLEVLQTDVLVAHDGATVDIVAGRVLVGETHLAEAVIGETVEQRVAHGGRGLVVDAILRGRGRRDLPGRR